jgi:MFS family permease
VALTEKPRRAEQTSRLPVTVILLGLTSFFTDVGTEMIFPLLPVFLTETLRAGPAYLGLVEGAADTVSSLTKLVSGALADVLPRRKPLVLFGYALASAARPFVALAMRPWHVLAVRVTDRIGKGVRSSPRDALIADAAGERVGRAFGFHQAMDNAGAVVGPLLATGLIALQLSIRSVFWVAVIPGAIATALVALVREPARNAHKVERTEAALAGMGAWLGDRRMLLYLGILALFSLGNSSDAFLLLRASSLGLRTAEVPILWSALNLSKVLWAYFGGDLADRFPRARLIAVGWLVYALVYVGLGSATKAWHAWVLFGAYGIFYGLTEPVEKALVKDLARKDLRGRAYGAYNFVIGVTALPAGLLTGMLWRIFGPTIALRAAAALAGVASVLLLIWASWASRFPRSSD